MMKKLWLGRYIDGSSVYHAFDPRSKLVMMVLNLLMIICTVNWEQLLCVTLFTFSLLCLSKIPFSFYLRQAMFLKYMYFFFLMFFTLTEGTTFLLKIGIFRVSLDGLWIGAFYVTKMMLFVILGALLTFTTSPGEIVAGVRTLFKSPSIERFAFMAGLSIRLIPMILEEVKLIYNAQQSRGLDFSELRLQDKFKKLLSIIIPAISNTVKRLMMMIEAMACRGYVVGEQRTSIYRLQFRMRDVCLLVYGILVLAIVILL